MNNCVYDKRGGGAVRDDKSAKNVLVLDQELDQPN